MIIEKIEIESFGAIKNLTLDLKNELNIIQGSNESGKSSIADFIKFMLYGLNGKSIDGHLSERKKAINFLESHAGGSMTVLVDEKRYKISRSVSVSGKTKESVHSTVSITDPVTGSHYFEGEEPGEALLGIGEHLFVSSAYLRQAADVRVDGNGINEAISNLLFSGDERINAKKATDKIDSQRVSLLHKNGRGGKITELKEEIAVLEQSLGAALENNEKIIASESSLSEKKAKLAQHQKNINDLTKQIKANQTLKLLESMQALSGAEAEKVSSELELLEYKAGVHIPTEEEADELFLYQRSLSGLLSEAKLQDARALSLESEKARLAPALSLGEIVEKTGGREKMISLVDTSIKRSKRCLALSAVSLLLSAAGFICSIAVKPYMIPSIIFGSVMAVCFLLLTAVSLTSKAKAKKICRYANAQNKEELVSALDSFDSTKAQMSRIITEYETLLESIAQNKELYKCELGKLREYLRDMDIEDCSDPLSSIPKISDTLRMRMKKAAELEMNATLKASIYTALLEKTENVDETSLLETLGQLGVEDPAKVNVEQAEKNIAFYKAQEQLLSKTVHDTDIELAALRATAKNPSSISEELDEKKRLLQKCEYDHAVYMLSIKAIEEAGEKLRAEISPALAKMSCKYMSDMTEGKYEKINLDKYLNLTYEAAADDRHADYMSTGTKNLAYISLRLSISDMLGAENPIPTIFDEATAHLDDNRARQFLKVLSDRADSGVQHILFTCHKREAELLSDSDIRCNHITL